MHQCFLSWADCELNESQPVYRTVSPSRGSAYPSNEPCQPMQRGSVARLAFWLLDPQVARYKRRVAAGNGHSGKTGGLGTRNFVEVRARLVPLSGMRSRPAGSSRARSSFVTKALDRGRSIPDGTQRRRTRPRAMPGLAVIRISGTIGSDRLTRPGHAAQSGHGYPRYCPGVRVTRCLAAEAFRGCPRARALSVSELRQARRDLADILQARRASLR